MSAMIEGAQKIMKVLEGLANGTTVDLTVRQLLILFRIAEAGDTGVDQGRLAEDTGASPASVSRTVRTLGGQHYAKQHEGFGLVQFDFDPTDNRKRIVSLTRDGQKFIRDLVAKL